MSSKSGSNKPELKEQAIMPVIMLQKQQLQGVLNKQSSAVEGAPKLIYESYLAICNLTGNKYPSKFIDPLTSAGYDRLQRFINESKASVTFSKNEALKRHVLSLAEEMESALEIWKTKIYDPKQRAAAAAAVASAPSSPVPSPAAEEVKLSQQSPVVPEPVAAASTAEEQKAVPAAQDPQLSDAEKQKAAAQQAEIAAFEAAKAQRKQVLADQFQNKLSPGIAEIVAAKNDPNSAKALFTLLQDVRVMFGIDRAKQDADSWFTDFQQKPVEQQKEALNKLAKDFQGVVQTAVYRATGSDAENFASHLQELQGHLNAIISVYPYKQVAAPVVEEQVDPVVALSQQAALMLILTQFKEQDKSSLLESKATTEARDQRQKILGILTEDRLKTPEEIAEIDAFFKDITNNRVEPLYSVLNTYAAKQLGNGAQDITTPQQVQGVVLRVLGSLDTLVDYGRSERDLAHMQDEFPLGDFEEITAHLNACCAGEVAPKSVEELVDQLVEGKFPGKLAEALVGELVQDFSIPSTKKVVKDVYGPNVRVDNAQQLLKAVNNDKMKPDIKKKILLAVLKEKYPNDQAKQQKVLIDNLNEGYEALANNALDGELYDMMQQQKALLSKLEQDDKALGAYLEKHPNDRGAAELKAILTTQIGKAEKTLGHHKTAYNTLYAAHSKYQTYQELRGALVDLRELITDREQLFADLKNVLQKKPFLEADEKTVRKIKLRIYTKTTFIDEEYEKLSAIMGLSSSDVAHEKLRAAVGLPSSNPNKIADEIGKLLKSDFKGLKSEFAGTTPLVEVIRRAQVLSDDQEALLLSPMPARTVPTKSWLERFLDAIDRFLKRIGWRKEPIVDNSHTHPETLPPDRALDSPESPRTEISVSFASSAYESKLESPTSASEASVFSDDGVQSPEVSAMHSHYGSDPSSPVSSFGSKASAFSDDPKVAELHSHYGSEPSSPVSVIPSDSEEDADSEGESHEPPVRR